ncbi:Histidine phosphatase superfamily clade-1 [Penicillium bovifimosum]|uniref:Histidine phosphatase superfamily clade-1 n=1 Tax=Penicillium bovifimosum TaxID=126998 RepID=A0A9W9GV64_9EURO|nr:Histidine phosphatase superfamily clade-1 [Penicillium bovifimosum]KAJ5130664.1 Histidine phosphatase superfamily clade-1 [Penicillium bovifimosum]
MIILVRHAQSEGNKNRDIHQTIPDHRVKLTPEGHRQAQDAGRRLRDLLNPDDKLHFFTSPYRRTRETTEGILESLTSDTPSPSPFPRHTIKVYEEPRLREQDFGNFQPCSTEMERMWMERADYGHFFYRIPNGESAADAYDRVSGFNESLWRLFGEDDFANVCVLVTHGLMARVFLMKWYHWSVEYFEDLRNINHCEFLVLTHNPENGKYVLQNKLRTWSDLRKERERESASKEQAPAPTTPAGQVDHVPIRRKWGGCPDGCTHGMTVDAKLTLRASLLNSMRHSHGYPKHTDDHVANFGSKLQRSVSIDEIVSSSEESAAQDDTVRKSNARRSSNPQHTIRNDVHGNTTKHGESSSDARPSLGTLHSERTSHHGLNRNSEDHHAHHPTASSSSSAHLKYALLHLGGRDGGGSMSGANSLAPSDDEGDDHHYDHHRVPTPSSSIAGALSHANQSNFAFPSNSHTRQQGPSQELEDDGDDEMSANPTEKSKNPRLHHPHHHHHHHHHQQQQHNLSSGSLPEHRMANILGDGDESSNPSETQSQNAETFSTGYPSHLHIEELSLEEQQKQDQSIQGSVY